MMTLPSKVVMQYCRCGDCGRFTGHWRFDESFCKNPKCGTEFERPKVIMCDDCADALCDE